MWCVCVSVCECEPNDRLLIMSIKMPISGLNGIIKKFIISKNNTFLWFQLSHSRKEEVMKLQ